MANWKDFCKVAQTWGYFAPAHEPSAAKEWHKSTAPIAGKALKAPVKAVTALSGAVTGALQQYGEAVGRGDLPAPDMSRSWWDYAADPSSMKRDTAAAAEASRQVAKGTVVGAKEGWNSAGRIGHDAMTTVARVGNDFGLVSDETVRQMRNENDNKMLENMRRLNVPLPDKLPRDPDTGLLVATGDPDYEEYDRFVNWARGGQGTGRFAFDAAALAAATQAMGAAGRAVGESVGAAPGTVARLSAAGAAIPTAAATTKTLANDVESGVRDADKMNVAEYRQMAEAMNELDASSPEYKELYEHMKKFSRFDQQTFKKIRPPAAAAPVARPGAVNVPPSENSAPASHGWSMSPETQNMIGYGLGGLGLGHLLGGWKLGLLGLLLGALHGGVGLGNLWSNLSKSWGGSK